MTPLPRSFHARYGPTALVTGASSGIGLAAARHLAAAGFDLVLVARGADALRALAGSLESLHRVRCTVLPLDLSDRASAATLFEATRGADIGLVVAAAGFGSAGDLIDRPLDEELALLDVNCAATLVIAHEFGGRLARRGRGGLVLMSSLFAFQGVPGSAHYAASKAYVQSLAEGLRPELAARGVDVVAAAPGPVASAFGARAGLDLARGADPATVALGMLRALGRTGTARPGWLSKALELALPPGPRSLRSAILARVVRGLRKPADHALCHDRGRDGDEATARPAPATRNRRPA